MWSFFSWIMSAVALMGTLMNAERIKYGFAFWLVSNLYMTIRFCVIGEFAQMTLFFIYFLLAIRGLIAWSGKEKQEKTERKKNNIYEFEKRDKK